MRAIVLAMVRLQGRGWTRDRSSAAPDIPAEIALMREVVATCRGLSRKELANTISELVGWTRANGLLKEAECLMLLTRLEATGLRYRRNSRRDDGVGDSIAHDEGEPGAPLSGRLETLLVLVERIRDAGARQRFANWSTLSPWVTKYFRRTLEYLAD